MESHDARQHLVCDSTRALQVRNATPKINCRITRLAELLGFWELDAQGIITVSEQAGGPRLRSIM